MSASGTYLHQHLGKTPRRNCQAERSPAPYGMLVMQSIARLQSQIWSQLFTVALSLLVALMKLSLVCVTVRSLGYCWLPLPSFS